MKNIFNPINIIMINNIILIIIIISLPNFILNVYIFLVAQIE
jgi:hypothetical protein